VVKSYFLVVKNVCSIHFKEADMLRVVGQKNCGKCTITKQILDGKGVEYEYSLLSDLPQEEQRRLAKMARDCSYNTMPLIIKDDRLITLQEV
jgi:glutaredoxin